MNKITATIKLLRPLNLFTSAIAVYFSSLIIGSDSELLLIMLTVGVVVCFNAGANAYNDFVDYEIDKINQPNRPLSLGALSQDGAFYISVILFLIGSFFSFQLNDGAKLISIGIALPLMILYSGFLKGQPLVGNIVVSLILGLTFIFSGAAFGQVKLMIIPAILAFGLTFIRELVKDIADVEGDKSAGLRTYPIVAGISKSVRLVTLLSGLVGLGAFIPYFIDIYGIFYGILLILGVEIPLGVVVVSLQNNPGKTSAIRGAKLLKFSTIIGLLAIYLGSIYDI
ncbi:MAG: geranylgeranylglycerol-phosphate geranylgeranyltransferase [Candidatus Marinimicrobia bacterium]|nr:geranylgeranylglycerol-phosphate geranylgeranyltransferase [Candidatus Neomarinimicrobiota bacterium]